MGKSKQGTTNFEDIIQVVVGASALSVPVAFSEEAWNLGRTLPVGNIILLIVLSLLFVNLYSLHNIFQGRTTHWVLTFFSRTVSVYCITLLVAVVVLAVKEDSNARKKRCSCAKIEGPVGRVERRYR